MYKIYKEKKMEGKGSPTASLDSLTDILSKTNLNPASSPATVQQNPQQAGAGGVSSPVENQPSQSSPASSKRIDVVEDETEMKILASFLNDSFSLSKSLQDGFEPGLFKNKIAQEISKTIIHLFQSKKGAKKIDKVVLKDRLNKSGLLDSQINAYLDKLYQIEVLPYAEIKDLFEIVKERAQVNGLMRLKTRIEQYVKGEGEDAKRSLHEFIAVISKELHDMQKRTTDKKVKLIKEQMLEIVKVINLREQTGEIENLGYSIKPYYDLNSALSGLRKGFLYAMAGAPRRGKTTFTLELATLVASNEKIPVLFYTWEQTKQNLTYRLLAKESQINPDTLQRKRILADDELEEKFQQGWRKMERYMDYFHIIEGTKEDTVERIKAHAYNTMQAFDTDDILIVVDYIQKMPLSMTYQNEKFKVEEISTLLKGLTIELNCPVLAISSLNKEGCNIDMADNNDRPGLYHCKGSGDIEYDLDAAMILAKDWEDSHELYTQLAALAEDQGKDVNRLPKVDIVNIYIDKNRDAPEGISNVIQYFFLIEANKFVELGYKVDGDNYRFSKIEKLVKQLFEEGYIRFRNVEDKDDFGDMPRKRTKIRLRYD
jgi:replicative DNA helicase